MAEHVATMKPKGRRFNGFRVFTYVVLTLAALIYVLPFAWMLARSVQNDYESRSTTLIPSQIVLQNYVDVLQGSNTLGISRQFSGYLWTTVKLEVLSVTLQTIVCVLAAYAFARIHFPGRDLLFGLFLMTIFVPSIILLVPSLIIVTNISKGFEAIDPSLKWINNWPSLVIPFLANTFSIFLLRQFFKQIPDELWDAARIDGAGHLRFLWRVVVPNSRAAVMTTILFAFIGVWSALEWPILVTTDDTWRPIAVALLQFRQDGGELTNYLMAASVIALIPIMVIYFFTQRQFTQGIVTTGLKG